ncbi:MAG TPA: PaaI family thioesterase [Syntrophorhabdaceae bacterium]|nr:PaaI family thioesterase [Syntrophorhabdaceae bacterium]HQM82335.1 PaaI family thioesterase [Syntrophorhabdaceae bacterium]
MHGEYILKIFNECGVGRLIGIEICEVREGFAKGKLTLNKEHMNIFGSVHGGILYAFADQVGGACGNSLGRKAVLVESTIQYLKGAAAGETIFGEAQYTYKGKKIGRIDIKVYNDREELLAIIHNISYTSENEHSAKT